MWRRSVEALVKRVYQREGCSVVKRGGRLRKTIGQNIKRVSELNDVSLSGFLFSPFFIMQYIPLYPCPCLLKFCSTHIHEI